MVFKGYHFITNPTVHALVDYLIEHAPPSMRLAELRAADPEVTHWLKQAISALPDHSVHASLGIR